MNSNMNALDINKNSEEIYEEENINSDNSFIEELRIQLEVALGFSLFKTVYNIIHDNVILCY